MTRILPYLIILLFFISLEVSLAPPLNYRNFKDVNGVDSNYNNIGPLQTEEQTADSVDNIVRFDSNYFAPAYQTYLFWDTLDVHPYKVDLSRKSDTTVIILQDSTRRYSHPVHGEINSDFGYRRYKFHYGTDIDLRTGDSVYCAFDGLVRIKRYSRSYGYVVVVRHYNGLETLYGHLSKPRVNINQELKAGDLVGLGGSTGRSSGPHLHFEVRYLGEPINPNDIIDFERGVVRSDTLYLNGSHFAYLIEARAMKYHTIRSGDTLSRISRKYGVSISTLCSLNNIRTTTVLRIGRKLRYN